MFLDNTGIQRDPGGTGLLRLSFCDEEGTPSSDKEEESQTEVEKAELDPSNSNLVAAADGSLDPWSQSVQQL